MEKQDICEALRILAHACGCQRYFTGATPTKVEGVYHIHTSNISAPIEEQLKRTMPWLCSGGKEIEIMLDKAKGATSTHTIKVMDIDPRKVELIRKMDEIQFSIEKRRSESLYVDYIKAAFIQPDHGVPVFFFETSIPRIDDDTKTKARRLHADLMGGEYDLEKEALILPDKMEPYREFFARSEHQGRYVFVIAPEPELLDAVYKNYERLADIQTHIRKEVAEIAHQETKEGIRRRLINLYHAMGIDTGGQELTGADILYTAKVKMTPKQAEIFPEILNYAMQEVVRGIDMGVVCVPLQENIGEYTAAITQKGDSTQPFGIGIRPARIDQGGRYDVFSESLRKYLEEALELVKKNPNLRIDGRGRS